MIHTFGWVVSLLIVGSVIVGSLIFVFYFDYRWRR